MAHIIATPGNSRVSSLRWLEVGRWWGRGWVERKAGGWLLGGYSTRAWHITKMDLLCYAVMLNHYA